MVLVVCCFADVAAPPPHFAALGHSICCSARPIQQSSLYLVLAIVYTYCVRRKEIVRGRTLTRLHRGHSTRTPKQPANVARLLAADSMEPVGGCCEARKFAPCNNTPNN